MIILALDTGMRRGEITSQRWEDIDLSRQLLFVTRSKTPEGESREIPLTGRLLTLLLERRQEEALLIEFRGKPVRIVKRAWQGALRRASLRHIRFHDLRHTFNTRLMEAGVIQDLRMALMGHSSGSRVHATYTHIELPVKRDAIRKLEHWVNQQRNELQKEDNYAHTETNGSQTAGSESDCSGPQARQPKTVEEEDARGGGLGTGRQAQGRDCRDRGGAEGQAASTAEIRRSQKAL
jgi:hypothetical protein